MNILNYYYKFIVCEGFNTPPLGAIKKVLNPEANTLPKQHTPLLAAGLLIEKSRSLCRAYLTGRRVDILLLVVAAIAVLFIAIKQVPGAIDKPRYTIVTVSAQCEYLFGKDTINAIVQEFEEQNPGIRIQIIREGVADIVFFDDSEFGRLVKESTLVSLAPYINKKTQTWAVPLVSFMDIFLYNIDILRAAHYDRPPKTRAEFLAAAQAVTENNKQVFPFALGLSREDPLALRRDIYPWIWANGEEIFTVDGRTPELSRSASDVIAFVGQLSREGLLAPETFEKTGSMRLEEFAAGKIAMMTASVRDIAFLRRNAQGVNFGITAMPSAIYGKNRLGLSAIYAGITGNCMMPDEAWTCLSFIAEKSQNFATALGAVPGSFPNAFSGEYIEEEPLYSKAWDIFEVADIVEYNPGGALEEEIGNSIREKLVEAVK